MKWTAGSRLNTAANGHKIGAGSHPTGPGQHARLSRDLWIAA